ncbi:MAG: class I SAM-dependent methyltransferase [Alphaproteobacteria bacterium]|nr:class I SAM-dependent methyltransferase [Alphaproteobacteria bacterium]
MDTNIDEATRTVLESYLTDLYKGVFTREAIGTHLDNHVGFAFADYATQVIRPRLYPGAKVLDIGSGFGSCVLAARNAGLDAIGVEIAPFEVDFARTRLAKTRPDDTPEKVYLCGDARKLDIAPASLDAVTFWNVIEHIDNWGTVIDSAAKYLKPGGLVFILCPNYMAWRDEAHYHVPWKPAPLLPKKKAVKYLESLGRDPRFFAESIFYRTNWEVLGKLRSLDFDLMELGTCERRTLAPSRILPILLSPVRHFRFFNPFRHSVEVAARKPVGSHQ